MNAKNSGISFVPFQFGELTNVGWKWDANRRIFEDPRFGQVVHVIFRIDGVAKNDQMLRVERAPGCFIPITWDGRVGQIGLIEVAFRPQIRDIDTHLAFWPYKSVEALTDNLGRSSWEVPRGYAKVGETGQEAADREGAEETGSQVTASVKLGDICGNTAIEPHFLTVTAGLIDVSKKVEGDPNEKLLTNLRFFEINEIARMINDGRIYCGITLAAFAKFTATGPEHVIERLLRH